jgi:hypothetical protein
MIVKFPIESGAYWLKMIQLHDPLPIFKIGGDCYVIKKFVLNEVDTYPPWSHLHSLFNREACEITFYRIFHVSKD